MQTCPLEGTVALYDLALPHDAVGEHDATAFIPAFEDSLARAAAGVPGTATIDVTEIKWGGVVVWPPSPHSSARRLGHKRTAGISWRADIDNSAEQPPGMRNLASALVSKALSSSSSPSEDQLRLELAEALADVVQVREALVDSTELQTYGDFDVTGAQVEAIVFVSGKTTLNNLDLLDEDVAHFMLAYRVCLARVVADVPGTSVARATEIPEERNPASPTDVSWLVEQSAVASGNVGAFEKDLRRTLADALQDLEGFRGALVASGCLQPFGDFTVGEIMLDAFDDTGDILVSPTVSPADTPSVSPTISMSPPPTVSLSNNPSTSPSIPPTKNPTKNLTKNPTKNPTETPSGSPLVGTPTIRHPKHVT